MKGEPEQQLDEKEKETKPIYVAPATHQKIKVFAGFEKKSMRDLLADLLDDKLDRMIAARMFNQKVRFKRQPVAVAANGKGRR